MKRSERRLSVCTAALLSVLMLSSCVKDEPTWKDTLPKAVTEAKKTSFSVMSEEISDTDTTVSLPPRETTARTAATSPQPELATTVSTSAETEDGTTAVSTVPGVPRVPISEFTATAPSEFSVSTASSGETSSLSSEGSGAVTSDTEETSGTEDSAYTAKYEVVLPNVKDPFAPYSFREEILRPYSYGSLNEKQTYMYDAMITAIEQGKTDVNFSKVMGVTRDDCMTVYQQLFQDELAMYYLSPKFMYSVNPSTQTVSTMMINYSLSNAEIRRMNAAIDAEVENVLAGITSDMSQYDIVKYFYDYLAETIIYDDEAENCTNIYGAFVGKRALCQAYAKGFTYLCSKVGIESLLITGDAMDSSNHEPHMWNMVKLGSSWYHIDPTFARADSDARGVSVRYTYFCLSDEMIKNKRSIYEQTYTYPAANSEKCNYFEHSGLVAEDIDTLEDMLIEQLIEAADAKRTSVQVRCSDKEFFDEAKELLFGYTEKQAIDIMEDAADQSENKFRSDNFSYSYDSDIYIITLYLDYI